MIEARLTWARIPGFVFAATAFVGTWVFFTWFAIFLGNLPKRAEPWIDPTVSTGQGFFEGPFEAALANAMLLSLFCLQHSLMARPRFKQFLASLLPPALERATYVHAANLTGFVFLYFWTPIPQTLWSIDNDAAKALIWIGFGAGWLILFLAALSINVWELLGLRQAWRWFCGFDQMPLELKTTWLYRYLEHPMYVGVLLGFWMTPHMTVGHALLASQLTLYIVLAMAYERRDLHRKFGGSYQSWRCRGAEPVTARMPDSATARIAAELQRSLHPVVLEPLPKPMVALLSRI